MINDNNTKGQQADTAVLFFKQILLLLYLLYKKAIPK